LAALAKGAPWGLGQQGALVTATNAENPFAPFTSKMAAPPGLAAGSTTVNQWEQIVWERQSPPTACKGLA
jgi:hypothetical protein